MRLIPIAIGAILIWATPTQAQSVSEISRRWAADWSNKKIAAIMTLYAPAPTFLPTYGKRWTGREEIEKNFRTLLAKFNPHIVMRSRRSEISGNLAYDSGDYDEVVMPMKTGKPIRASGSYLFLFQRRKGGSWKILEQTWTQYDPSKL